VVLNTEPPMTNSRFVPSLNETVKVGVVASILSS
jgi:hypothetical protein